MDPSQTEHDGKFSEVSSSSKTLQRRTVPNSRAASTDASASTSVTLGLTRENTSSSTEQGSMSSSAALLPSITSAAAEATGSDLSAPVQKRRRITRACDECRRKKIKCDGKQPCLHCTVYTYECTYDQPSNRSRKPHPQYVESLEQRLRQAEGMLKSLVPGIEVGEQSFLSRQQKPITTNTEDRQTSSAITTQSVTVVASDLPTGFTNTPAQGSNLEPSLYGTPHFEVDQNGLWYHCGYSSGLGLIKQVHKAFTNASSKQDIGQSHSLTNVSPSSPSTISLQRISSKLFGPSTLVNSTPSDVESSPSLLSLSREVIYRLCDIALQDASTLCPIVHEPTFMRSLNRIVDLPKTDLQYQDRRFMPLLFAVLAVGCIFAKDESLLASEEGNKYFKASQQLLNLNDCHDTLSLQTLLFIVTYLQLSANVSACYFYIGVAVRSAYRQGLHRSLSNAVVENYKTSGYFSTIESEVRKRVFWAIFKIDVVVSSFLGLPICSHDVEIDQEYLAEVDDEGITETGIKKANTKDALRPSAANAHSNLVKILKKINRWIFPVNGTIISSASDDISGDHTKTKSEPDRMKYYMARNQKIKEIERDLQNWSDVLPFELRPNGDAPPRKLRIQQLLRFLFAQTQMALYGPLLHEFLAMYDSSEKGKIGVFEEELSRYAGNCVNVARNMIHITSEARSQYLLQKDHWFAIYTTFFALIITAGSLLGGSANRTDEGLLDDMQMGKEALANLSRQSVVANRCHATLESVLENSLNDILHDRSKVSKNYDGRKLILSYETPNVEKTSQLPTNATISSLSGSSSESLPYLSSTTMEQSSHQLHQQVSQQQQYAEKHMLDHKQQQYRNFMANLYQSRPVPHNPASSRSSRLQDMPIMTSKLTEQASSSLDTTYPPEASNSNFDALLPFAPSTTLPPDLNPQLPFADISDLLFTPADPFAYPFSPFAITSADATAGTSIEQAKDIEMADYFKLTSPAASHGDMHITAGVRNYGIENNTLGMEYEWSQGEVISPLPVSTSVSRIAPTSTKTSLYANLAVAGNAGDADQEQYRQFQQVQRQQQLQSQPLQRRHRDGYGQGENCTPDQRQFEHSSVGATETRTISGSVPSSGDDSNDGDADDDGSEAESDDDNDEDGDDDDDGDDDEDNEDDENEDSDD